jgi:hypothetical protein
MLEMKAPINQMKITMDNIISRQNRISIRDGGQDQGSIAYTKSQRKK